MSSSTSGADLAGSHAQPPSCYPLAVLSWGTDPNHANRRKQPKNQDPPHLAFDIIHTNPTRVMAFVQQGPRRTRSHRERPSADATPSTSISQLPASNSYQSAATRATDTASTSKHHHIPHASHATDDWSIIFPGRVTTRQVDQKLDAGQDPPQASTANSHIFTSQHNGTESFGTYDLDFPADISSGHTSSPLVHREVLSRKHSSDSATSQVPSLLLSAHALHPPTFSASQRSSSTSRSTLLSPSSALIFGDEDDVVSNASWDLSEQQDHSGPAQLTSSSIDLQQSMERAQRPVIYATDSESEEEIDIANEASSICPSRRRRDSEARFEEALAATPFAQSAGLHPRRSLRPRSSVIAATDDSASVLSGRSSALSGGFKRRHRRQLLADEQRIARSNKSRRSEAVVDNHALEGSSKATEIERQARRLATKGKSRVEEQIHPTAKPVTRSKAARMAKLLGKMFDVDDDVMDALMEDKGPLAPVKEVDPSAMPSRFQPGFEHDAVELNGSAGPKKWRELIDGRIVEDDEDSEREHHTASIPNDVQDEADIDRALSWMTGPATSASAEASSSRLDTPTLRDALQHTFSRIATGPSAALFSPGQYQQLQHQHGHLPLTNAVVQSMSDGIANALPYFIPFSWRMLMRLMNQWNQEQQEQQRRPALDEGKDQQSIENEENTAQEQRDHQQDTNSAKSSEGSHRSSDRGRDQQIKKLGLSIDSDWTSPSSV